MKFLRLFSSVAALGCLLGLVACKPRAGSARGTPTADSSGTLPSLGPAPAWKLKDLDGKDVTSEQFKGKVVVLDFWATWCPPCRGEIPGYVELQKKYGKDGLLIVGISMDDKGPEPVKEFVQEQGIN